MIAEISTMRRVRATSYNPGFHRTVFIGFWELKVFSRGPEINRDLILNHVISTHFELNF